MSTELIPVQDLTTMARAIASSGFGGCKTPEQALTLMLIAQAEGRHPGIIARDYHIINGRPSIKADAMLARFQEAGGAMRWIELTDTRAEAVFSHPKGGEIAIDWDLERAKKAGVFATNPNWQKYPRNMLRARVVSEGVRTILPGVVCGTYTPEEVDDMEPRTPEYSVQPRANASAAQEVGAMHDAQKKAAKPAPSEENRPDFVEYLQKAAAQIGSFEPIIEVVTSHGYDDPDHVQPKDFRPIMAAVKELLPKA